MGRFDSPTQIVGLFVIASFVSVGLIFFINAEQQSRLAGGSRDVGQSHKRGKFFIRCCNHNIFIYFVKWAVVYLNVTPWVVCRVIGNYL